MENFEEVITSDESADIPQPAESVAEPAVETAAEPAAETAYRGAGAGRKESPYANSPYVMQHPVQESPRREKKPAKPKKKPTS